MLLQFQMVFIGLDQSINSAEKVAIYELDSYSRLLKALYRLSPVPITPNTAIEDEGLEQFIFQYTLLKAHNFPVDDIDCAINDLEFVAGKTNDENKKQAFRSLGVSLILFGTALFISDGRHELEATLGQLLQ